MSAGISKSWKKKTQIKIFKLSHFKTKPGSLECTIQKWHRVTNIPSITDIINDYYFILLIAYIFSKHDTSRHTICKPDPNINPDPDSDPAHYHYPESHPDPYPEADPDSDPGVDPDSDTQPNPGPDPDPNSEEDQRNDPDPDPDPDP